MQYEFRVFLIRKTSLLFTCFYKFKGVSGAGSMHLLRDNCCGQVDWTPCISMSLESHPPLTLCYILFTWTQIIVYTFLFTTQEVNYAKPKQIIVTSYV